MDSGVANLFSLTGGADGDTIPIVAVERRAMARRSRGPVWLTLAFAVAAFASHVLTASVLDAWDAGAASTRRVAVRFARATIGERESGASSSMDASDVRRVDPSPSSSSGASNGGGGNGEKKMTKTAGNGKFHVLMTSDGSPYQRWQSRAMYYHYEKQRAKAGAAGAIGDFTRLLHSGVPDDLMSEIPTVVVNKLPPDVDDGGYVVLHRPYAIKQWLDSHAAAIEEEFVLLAEPDHLFLRPMPLLASNETAVGYPFFYITPNDDAHWKILQKFNAARAPRASFPPTGNSPCMLSIDALRAVTPIWHDLAVRMKHDPEADAAFGWVLEMWAYSVAVAQAGVKHAMVDELMIHPPWDASTRAKSNGRQAFVIHYTYGQDFTKSGQMTNGKVGDWHWDKRDHTLTPPGKIPPPPRKASGGTRALVKLLNEAMDNIPEWDRVG